MEEFKEYIRILFYVPWVPLLPLTIGFLFFFITSKYSFIKSVNIRARILSLSPLIMFILAAFVGGAYSSDPIFCFFGFMIGLSFMGLFSFYNLKQKSIYSKIMGGFFISIYIFFAFSAIRSLINHITSRCYVKGQA